MGTLCVETLVASVCVDTSVVSGPLPALSEQTMNPLWEHPLFCTSPRRAVGGPLRELLFPGVKSLLLRNKHQNRSHSCGLSSLWVQDPKSRLGRAYLPPRACDGCRGRTQRLSQTGPLWKREGPAYGFPIQESVLPPSSRVPV